MTNDLIIIDDSQELAPVQLLDIATPENLEKELERDPRTKSKHTQRGYLWDLKAFEEWRAGRVFNRLVVEEYAAELQAAGKAPASINRALAAIRWYARRWAAIAQEVPANTDQELRDRAEMVARAERVASVLDVTGSRLPAGRHITPGELAAIMAACEDDSSPLGLRDAALIAVAYSTGPRRAELGGLAMGDFTLTDENEGDLLFHGKGDKQRLVPIWAGYIPLVDWLDRRGPAPGPIFCGFDRGWKINLAESLTGEAMRLILGKRRRAAGVAPLTWHDFRRTFAGNLLDSGVDPVTVQYLMGHANITTTAGYDRRGYEVKRRAVKVLFVPYKRNQAWAKT